MLLIPKIDLFAVLCPSGPLKMLISIAEERQESIPALIYSAGMASFDNDTDVIGGYRTQQSNSTKGFNWSSWLPFSKSNKGYRTIDDEEEESVLRDGIENARLSISELTDLTKNNNSSRPAQRRSSHHDSDDEYEDVDEYEDDDDKYEDDDDELNAIKLGLGDFIFYSVLVGKASRTNAVTLCLCIVAILTVSNTLILVYIDLIDIVY